MHLELNDQLAENDPETDPRLEEKKLQNLGWGMRELRQSDRFQRLETQVEQLTQTLSALGPVLQQVLHTQQAQQSTLNMPQRPDPPAVAPPSPFNPGSVHQTPGQASESNPLPSQTNHPNVLDPNRIDVSGTQPSDPWQANDPWRNFHQSPAQAAGIPDQPFPTSMPQNPECQNPFEAAQPSMYTQMPCPPGSCPPGLSQIPMSQTGLFPGMPSNPASVGQPPIQIDTPHGSHRETGEDNPFKRSERWMPNMPLPTFDEWKTRPLEITGFLSWLTSLASWTGLGSNTYPSEIMMCIKETEPLGWHRLSPSQVTRSVRLLSILKTCFSNHARASLVIRNYMAPTLDPPLSPHT